MITEKELYQLKRGDKVLVKCTVEAVFVKSGMVMVTTRDCDKGFDAYEDEVIAVMPDNVTNGDVIKALFPNAKYAECKNVIALHTEYFGVTHFDKEWWNALYKEGDKNGKGRDD